MLVPLSWLKEVVDVTLPLQSLRERLTLAGLTVDTVHSTGEWWDADFIRVGRVVGVYPHPDADRLVLVDVDYGGAAPQRVVTGAPNLYAFKGAASLPTLKVAFARAGATLIDAYSTESPRPKKKLKPSKIRGVESAGMVCSERELGLSEEHEGIILLPADAPVGLPLRDYLGDQVLDIEVTPDMARCLSVLGVAREVAALTDAPLHLPADLCQTQGNDQASDYAAVQIADPQLCNRYTGLVITDVTIGSSPKWLQERLVKAGMRPINNVVDITNYVMLEYGQPLHAFDYDILRQRAGGNKPTIIVRRAAANEKFTTLDGQERLLDDSMLMICDMAGSLAIAGVMGGLESEVRDNTRTVLLEAATFEGINNRRTGSKLKLFSEASYRFARGVPASLAPLASRRAAEFMREIAGGRIVPGLVDQYPVAQTTRLVYTTASDLQRILGMPIALEQAASALRRLDCAVEIVQAVAVDALPDATFALRRVDEEPLLACTAPWHRLDLAIPADLAEEVARMIGYEDIGLTLMNEVLPTQRRNEIFESEEKVRDILVNLGLQETINYPLTTPENHDKLLGAGFKVTSAEQGRGKADPSDSYVTLANPISPERSVMRRSLLVSALENTARNLRYTNRLANFEVGRVYFPETGDGLRPEEERRISLALTGPRRASNFHGDAEAAAELDFFDLKGVVETLLARLGFADNAIEYRAKPNTGTFGPRCAEVLVNGQSLGLMGELHPQVRSSWDLPDQRINVAELKLTPLVKPQWQLEPMPPVSNYPAVVEDLAFVVQEEVLARQLQEAIRAAGGALLTQVELFDIYRGDPLPAGHKSVAWRLTYQSHERSPHEKEVEALRRRIIGAVEKATGGKLRG